MPNTDTHSSSSDAATPGNGVTGVKQPAQEGEPPYTDTKYVLEDFSQQRINRGQQKINYLIVETNEKIVAALKQLSIALGPANANSGPVAEAIKQVADATEKIAGEFPPGCSDPR